MYEQFLFVIEHLKIVKIKTASTHWEHNLFRLYASLKPNVNYAQVAPKIGGLIEKHSPITYGMMRQQVIMQPMADRLYLDVWRHWDPGARDCVH
jgi:hypothetical protein